MIKIENLKKGLDIAAGIARSIASIAKSFAKTIGYIFGSITASITGYREVKKLLGDGADSSSASPVPTPTPDVVHSYQSKSILLANTTGKHPNFKAKSHKHIAKPSSALPSDGVAQQVSPTIEVPAVIPHRHKYEADSNTLIFGIAIFVVVAIFAFEQIQKRGKSDEDSNIFPTDPKG